MGFYDRDYYREAGSGTGSLTRVTRTAVGVLIAIHVAAWVGQLIMYPDMTWFLAASTQDILGLRVWKLLTAMFADRGDGVWNFAWNMIFLFFFGRELEQIYGRKDFLIFYVLAGTLSTAVEVTALGLSGLGTARVFGSSGAVMGVVALFTLFYPNRRILFFFFIALPVWVLCAIFVVRDLFGVFSGEGNGYADLSHLAGAVVGFLYWYLDLRWRRIGRRWFRWSIRNPFRRRQAKIIPMPRHGTGAPAEADAVSRRIDQLLAKISSHGKDSLTQEEWDFLRDNSARYRSEPPS